MPQPLDPAVEVLMANTPRPPLDLPNPALSLAERAQAFRARNDEHSPPAFDGEIEDSVVPPPELGDANEQVLGRKR